MKNTEKLKILGILGDVRMRAGAEDGKSESHDEIINEWDNDRIMFEWVAWKLGYGQWWDNLKGTWDALEELSNESSDEEE